MTSNKRQKIIYSTLVLVLLLFNIANYLFAFKYVNAFLDHRLDLATTDLSNRISSRITNYSDALYSAASLFKVDANVTPEDWHNFISSTEVFDRHPGTSVIGYAPVISEDKEGDLNKQAAAFGITDYQVKPSHSSSVEAPVLYLEPRSPGNDKVLGFNLFAEPERKAAIEFARDNDSIAITNVITTETEPEVKGLLMVLPVYKNGADVSTVDLRRANIIGFVTTALKPNDVMEGISLHVVPGVKFQVFDNSANGDLSEKNLIYNSGSDNLLKQGYIGRYVSVNDVQLPNTVWHLRITIVPETTFARLIEAAPYLILLLSIVISLLVFFAAVRLIEKYELLKITAKDAADRLITEDAVVDAYEDGIIATDPHGLIMVFNKRSEQVLGFLEPEVIKRRNIVSMISGQCLQEHVNRVSQEMNVPSARAFDCLITRSLIDGSDQLDLEFITKAGKKLKISVQVRPLYDSSNFLLGYQFIFRDGRKL